MTTSKVVMVKQFQNFGSNSNMMEEQETLRDCCSKDRIMTVLGSMELVGMDIVFNPRKNALTRFIWLSALVICFVICLIWTYDRVSYYYSTPLSVSVQIQESKALAFPAMTFCNENAWNVEALKNITGKAIHNDTEMYALLDSQNLSIQDLWDLAGHTSNKLVKECWFGRGIRCRMAGDFVKVYTVMGVCYTMTIENKTRHSGSYHNLYLKLWDKGELYNPAQSGWKIMFHTPNHVPNLDILTTGFSIPLKWGKDVQVAETKLESLPTSTNPCIQGHSYERSQCLLTCFSASMYKETQCVMPYMSGVEGPGCDTLKSYEKAQRAYMDQFVYGQWNVSACGCGRSCDSISYKLAEEVSEQSARKKHEIKLRAYFQDMTFTYIEENYAYSRIAMLCHIGGALGLLLGGSVLNLVELLEMSVRTFTGTKNKVRSATPFQTAR